jgi:hypothetical protein
LKVVGLGGALREDGNYGRRFDKLGGLVVELAEKMVVEERSRRAEPVGAVA